jgi:mannose-6-phosphate isomerase-like protein (cupin superfamily)
MGDTDTHMRKVRGMLADRGGGHSARELMLFALPADDQPPFGMSRFRVEPGGDVAEDCHSERELWCVLDGAGDLTVEGRTVGLRPGDNVFLVPGSTHSLHNPGATAMEVISIWWPPIPIDDPRRSP